MLILRLMVSDKPGVQRLVQICKLKGIKEVVFSPGSRNSPLVISFAGDPAFECMTIPDERVAGFFAMGMAQQLLRPVVICCTSGSAVVNYAPAVVEAYYQKIPLLVITADRPEEKIDQGAGQTMRQHNVYANYIKASYQLQQEAVNIADLQANDQLISDAIDQCSRGSFGPVHINFPLKEPLYQQTVYKNHDDLVVGNLQGEHRLPTHSIVNAIIEKWKTFDKKLIIFGQAMPNDDVNLILANLAEREDIAVISETTSNVTSSQVNPCIDRMITILSNNEINAIIPDVIISLGDAIVSKRIKTLFINHRPNEHWYVNEQDKALDTYECLTMHIKASALDFLTALQQLPKLSSHYQQQWNHHHASTQVKHNKFLEKCPWSDLKVFDHILSSVPPHSDLHISNSSPIRYTQLFNQRADINYFCNRGVSGIDGCTSTAAGAAHANRRVTTIITGDLAFMYDSNALWNQYMAGWLKIIIVNNGGGGIFKIIPGPETTDQYKEFFATEQSYTAEYIAKTFKSPYRQASSESELKSSLDWLYDNTFVRPAILEIMTLNEPNEDILSQYFNFLKSDKQLAD